MKKNIRDSLNSIKAKANKISADLSNPKLTTNVEKLTQLNKEYSEIKEVVENWNNYLIIEQELDSIEELLKDEDMKELAQEEKAQKQNEIRLLEEEIMIQLLPKDKDDVRNSFLELRAGAGGDEAAIFVGDLYRMYSRYAERSNWKIEKIKEIDLILENNETVCAHKLCGAGNGGFFLCFSKSNTLKIPYQSVRIYIEPNGVYGRVV